MELSNVLWIGGPAGAGKTTVARRLARRHGLRWYNSDSRTWIHRERARVAGVPVPDRGPGHNLYDRAPMIADDLRALPVYPLVVAEGGPITPAMVTSTRTSGRAVWLMPSREVQHDRLSRRHPEGVPAYYLQTWDRLTTTLADSPVTTLVVDSLTEEETLAEVERIFASALANGPTATGVDERRALVRYGNDALVTQHAGPLTRSEVPVDTSTVVRTFDCECADPACTALVDLVVADAVAAVAQPAPSILVPGH
ncbi:shikimate kinase [Actinopolymorpha rutila]|uniref:Shikimate kinase n=1 Tax=Actinopolymorpha rutila TaxID=446787 RepID=A0A852ZGH1_9ACTN|nr:shikimate kinase [Actinopolymorpha rutila]NYH90772.1 shikimate kinase [Actinopolymorpha rutila]